MAHAVAGCMRGPAVKPVTVLLARKAGNLDSPQASALLSRLRNTVESGLCEMQNQEVPMETERFDDVAVLLHASDDVAVLKPQSARPPQLMLTRFMIP
jgi:hypothetical protein